MIYLENNKTVYFDVDDTLIIWGQSHHEKALEFDCYGIKEMLVPHEEHIRFLKRKKNQGNLIVVWSQAGAQWAKHVVETLGLEPYVDLVVTKPTCYVDDLPAEAFMTSRVYFKPGHYTHGLPINQVDGNFVATTDEDQP